MNGVQVIIFIQGEFTLKLLKCIFWWFLGLKACISSSNLELNKSCSTSYYNSGCHHCVIGFTLLLFTFICSFILINCDISTLFIIWNKSTGVPVVLTPAHQYRGCQVHWGAWPSPQVYGLECHQVACGELGMLPDYTKLPTSILCK